jgi:hypothetical protein
MSDSKDDPGGPGPGGGFGGGGSGGGGQPSTVEYGQPYLGSPPFSGGYHWPGNLDFSTTGTARFAIVAGHPAVINHGYQTKITVPGGEPPPVVIH